MEAGDAKRRATGIAMISIAGNRRFQVRLVGRDGDRVKVNGVEHSARFLPLGGCAYLFLLDGLSFDILAEERGGTYSITVEGETYEVQVEGEKTGPGRGLARPERKHEHLEVRAPMPGLVAAVAVKVGQKVKMHQSLLILEAMKMENEIRSPREGSVREVRVEKGKAVEKNQVLVVLD